MGKQRKLKFSAGEQVAWEEKRYSAYGVFQVSKKGKVIFCNRSSVVVMSYAGRQSTLPVDRVRLVKWVGITDGG